jgi:tetratricopeptide (TPR) repeat protein
MGKTNAKIPFQYLSILLILAGISGAVLLLFSDTFQLVSNDSDIVNTVGLEEVVQNEDVFSASLLLAQEYCQGIDIEQANKTFDKIADELKVRIDGVDEPNKVVSIINDYLFVECQIQPDGSKVIDRLLVDKVLENKKGNCVGLSILYLALAERLDLPVFMKSVPSHVYLCYDDGFTRLNIETTMKGFICPDSYYSYHFPFPAEHQTINKLSKREVLGLFLSNLGAYSIQDPNALALHKKALTLFPGSAQINANTGLALCKLNELKKAKTYLIKAIKLDPTSWQGYLGIGNLYYESGDYKRASEAYVRSIDLLHRSVKILRCVLGLPEKERLNTLAREVLQSRDVPDEDLVGFGIGLFQQEEYELSNKFFGRALEVRPKGLGVYAYCAMTSFHLGDYEKARKYAQIADEGGGEIRPYSPGFFISTIADCYMKLGQSHAFLRKYELAFNEINKAIEIGGSNSQFFCAMAGAYLLKGDKVEANKFYKKAMALDPSNKWIQEQISKLSE